MTYFVGLDVSVKETAVSVVDAAGKVVWEKKVASKPDDIIRLLLPTGEEYGRIGIEADAQETAADGLRSGKTLGEREGHAA